MLGITQCLYDSEEKYQSRNRTHLVRRDSTVAILASSVGTAILETQYLNKCTLFIRLYLIYKSCS